MVCSKLFHKDSFLFLKNVLVVFLLILLCTQVNKVMCALDIPGLTLLKFGNHTDIYLTLVYMY